MTYNDIYIDIRNFIHNNYKFFENVEFVIGMSRGGLIPAVIVATKLNKPLVTAYIDKQDNIYFDRKEWLKDKNVLVVDDIVRSGRTLFLLDDYLKKNTEIKNISYYTIYNVGHLNKKEYNLNVSSIIKKEDITFPWDTDRKQKISIEKIEIDYDV